VYFLVGIIYQAKKGERGLAMLPNHEFWKDLPVKVKVLTYLDIVTY
jgi:hypothetical protein